MNTFRHPIVVFDSGMGGLSYLKTLQDRFKEEDFIYIADTAWFPYGTKNRLELRNHLLLLADQIVKKFQARALVIACNTATLAAAEDIEKELGIPVIGTRPPLARAVNKSTVKRIGLLATQSTIENPVLLEAIEKFENEASFVLLGATDLVAFVENRFLGSTQEDRLAELFPLTSYMLMEHCDVLILGCTHFLFLREDLQPLLPYIKLIDTAEEVADELAERLNLTEGASKIRTGQTLLYLTDDERAARYKAFCIYANITYRGVLNK